MPPKPRAAESTSATKRVEQWLENVEKRRARRRKRKMAEIQRKMNRVLRHLRRKSAQPYDIQILVVLVAAAAIMLYFVVLPKLDFIGPDGLGTPLLYMLSANAQAMASAFALVFSIAFVATQLSTRYGLSAASRFFDLFTSLMSVAFAAAVLLPLYVKGIPNPQSRAFWGGISLVFSTYCLLMLIPFAIWRVRQLGPQMVFDQLLPKKKPDDMWFVDSVEKLCKVEATIAAAFQALEYDFAQVGVDRLSDISVRAVRDDFRDGPQPFVDCLHRIALKVGNDYRVCWSLQRAVMSIGSEFVRRRYHLGHGVLTSVLLTLARRTYEANLAENARMAVSGFFSLSRDFAVTRDKTFFVNGVADFEALALDLRWMTMGFGVIGAWNVGCWKVAVEIARQEGIEEAECARSRLLAAVRRFRFDDVERAWQVALDDLRPYEDGSVKLMEELKEAWFQLLMENDPPRE